MNYLLDKLGYLENENRKTKLNLAAFSSKKEKPKVKNLSASIDKAAEIQNLNSGKKISEEKVVKTFKNIEIKKSRPVEWL